MKPLVSLLDHLHYDTEAIRQSVFRAMECDALAVSGKSVFVKPSFVYPARPPRNRGINTQPEVVIGVCQALRDLGASRILVGEDCLVGPSENAFVGMGILPALRGLAEPVYLQDDQRVEVTVENALVESRFRLPRSLIDADLFVSLPKLKVNMYAVVTLSVKNHVGLLLMEDRLTNHHYNIHKKIADLFRARIPDYTITDAIAAGAGQGPMHAEAVPLGLLIASLNSLAADAVACHLAGYDPEREVEHLRYLGEFGLGSLKLADIEVCPADLLEQRRRILVRPRMSFDDLHNTLRVFIGTELACSEGCLGMIRGTLDHWAAGGNLRPLRGLSFIAGRPLPELPEDLAYRRTLVIGDCAAPHRHRGTFIPGCPPHPIAITSALFKKGIWSPIQTRLRDLIIATTAHLLGLRVK